MASLQYDGSSRGASAGDILDALRRLFPRAEIHTLLDDVAEGRVPCSAFRTFVWHEMAKAAAEHLARRKWNLLDVGLRHKASEMAVLYTMHCVYERKALPDKYYLGTF